MSLLEVAVKAKPSVLVGATACGGLFKEELGMPALSPSGKCICCIGHPTSIHLCVLKHDQPARLEVLDRVGRGIKWLPKPQGVLPGSRRTNIRMVANDAVRPRHSKAWCEFGPTGTLACFCSVVWPLCSSFPECKVIVDRPEL